MILLLREIIEVGIPVAVLGYFFNVLRHAHLLGAQQHRHRHQSRTADDRGLDPGHTDHL